MNDVEVTYRERRLRKAERLRDWADKRQDKAAASFRGADSAIAGIEPGQPILVGHHSERRHRAALERHDSRMRAGIDHERTAAEMASRAANIEAAADRAIYDDDPDAIERLRAKVEALTAKRERMKAENAAFRKGPAAFAALLGVEIARAEDLIGRIQANELPWCRRPHPAYSLQNLGGVLRTAAERLERLERARTPRGEAFPASRGAETLPADALPLETATARAGLVITAGMTTPSRPGKAPRPVWTVAGNLEHWRPMLERMPGASVWRGVVSFWDDPTAEIDALCSDYSHERTVSDGDVHHPAD